MGAMLVADRAADSFQPGDHGSTFGGSPVPAAAALAHLRVRDELRLEDRVRARAQTFVTLLRDLARRHARVLGEPRGIGLLVGVPVHKPFEAKAIVRAAREGGLLIGTAGGNTLRFAPPLIIEEEELRRACALLDSALAAAA